jgi:hypothetical protein
MLVLVWQLPDLSPMFLGISLGFPIYYAVLSFALHRRRH